MRKKIIIGSIVGVFSFVLLYDFLGSHLIFKMYTITTSGCSPALNPGEYLAVTSLFAPKRKDIIAFKRYDSVFGNNSYVSRLVALEKDTIQMIKSEVYVNGESIDTQLRLQHSYILNKKQYQELIAFLGQEPFDSYPIPNVGYLCHLEKQVVTQLSSQPQKINNEKNKGALYKKDWDFDNFGPYIVPNNTFFVLGDNRHNSLDSRSFGPVMMQKYIGKAINKN